tara:strand:- start:5491 stop:6135 length:645 start_codon:yes stop_codon:yes gene_type:complete
VGAFKFIDVNQNSDEWFALRGGKLTSSNLGKIMANFGKSFGEPAKKYAYNIANEQITGEPISSDYSNAHMERGHEQEPIARMIYEEQTFCDVTNGGFFESDFIGCSPDGLVGDSGAIEIKSVISNVHYLNVKRQKVDPAYKWQCVGNLKFTSRDWLDFISYCSTYPEGKQIFIHRIRKEDLTEEFRMIDERVAEFKSLVDECKKTILESKYDNY